MNEDLLFNIIEAVKIGKPGMSQLIGYLRSRNKSIKESDIRQGVWRLIGRGVLEMTRDRKIAFRKLENDTEETKEIFRLFEGLARVEQIRITALEKIIVSLAKELMNHIHEDHGYMVTESTKRNIKAMVDELASKVDEQWDIVNECVDKHPEGQING